MMTVVNKSDSSDDDRRGIKRKMCLSSCDVCDTQEAKYKCPCCMKHTCSLECVKRHKLSSGCCGVRDKTAFVSLSQFNEISMLSDYRFLEDSDRLRQRSSRDAVLHASRQHPKEGSFLIRKARQAKVTLKFLPKIFSKHRENNTIFKNAEGQFYWHVKIHFPQSSAVYSERFPDKKQLNQILSDFIHPSESDPVKRQKLKVYVHTPEVNIRVFMKSEENKPNSPRYFEMDLKKSLGENLMNKTVVEYPEFYVVLKQHSQEYQTRTPEGPRATVPGEISKTSAFTKQPLSDAPTHVEKRVKVGSDDDELEDGEIRSEDEDETDEDDDVASRHHESESKAPKKHDNESDNESANESDEEDESDEEENQGSQDRCGRPELKDSPSNGCVQDVELQQNHSRTAEPASEGLGDGGRHGNTETVSVFSVTENDPLQSSSHSEALDQNSSEGMDDKTLQDDSEKMFTASDRQQDGHAQLPADRCLQDTHDENRHSHDEEEMDEAKSGSCEARCQGLSWSTAGSSENRVPENITASIPLEGLNQANISDTAENASASEGNNSANIPLEGLNQANISDTAENASASEGNNSANIPLEGLNQANISDTAENASASEGNNSANIPLEGLNQANISDTAENASASEGNNSANIPEEGLNQANISDSVEDANASASHGHIAADICGEGAS